MATPILRMIGGIVREKNMRAALRGDVGDPAREPTSRSVQFLFRYASRACTWGGISDT
jgi:hypothetical protein